ncbi:hypothetical protein [Pediococcus cellicola]|uniref:Uncharacterized protein n=1 Tax=Pediococcus cellicola TaxID=319652 RepID=A0A0R2IM21_9LACO|nr:hypothetical protein [Pediococcus cellicola]KRN66082.1 hypothetical protein IV80_GL001643 [Pediococcus cellicola]GEL15446.1 hypothetical protein PCE01_12480 [Pediococcus cellicola]
MAQGRTKRLIQRISNFFIEPVEKSHNEIDYSGLNRRAFKKIHQYKHSENIKFRVGTIILVVFLFVSLVVGGKILNRKLGHRQVSPVVSKQLNMIFTSNEYDNITINTSKKDINRLKQTLKEHPVKRGNQIVSRAQQMLKFRENYQTLFNKKGRLKATIYENNISKLQLQLVSNKKLKSSTSFATKYHKLLKNDLLAVKQGDHLIKRSEKQLMLMQTEQVYNTQQLKHMVHELEAYSKSQRVVNEIQKLKEFY